ncbi:AraC family transcriptional regulator [Photobacterium iliopiscarium]|jgi:AraC-like DNA-binding protein|uniref:AraC family transcriptional regulator n=1 Tax=Photobacterium iliopiscarium TaxID=56192 RepID=A0A0D8Q8P6_9GAMM|nr:helix-turn-helix domain-containing protein [Photobacterium iliopiscarium]KJG14689.1 AraC family transcriptional regulator [Photobacterium iliopiscarium]KJG26577.1 AraC family transcriptional regulator [Photobacterium iliopiscarium]PST97236.1 AraC family transcriptional regulator [Photobacterium iliopiscarium]PSU01834.1 AraC family transcriptional regulator [Photobacterium iliopiscarium]PSV84182.1 AraC family transcriptional regulator [Photobacterium iliopiscarium]
MKYKRILSQSHVVLKEFYVDHHLIVKLSNAEGNIHINGHVIDIKNNSILVIPKFSHISCSINQLNNQENIELQILMINEESITEAFKYISALKQPTLATSNCSPIYLIDSSEIVEQNFALFNQLLPSISGSTMEQTLLSQCLVFILIALNNTGIDVFNVYRFNYDEPKERTIARLITQNPQRKWSVDDMAKALFTTQSTLRRHLAKEGVSFSQLLLDVRMGLALNFLTFSNYSISQIGNRSGFGSAAYFCDAFKRKYNVTPSQFRTSSRKENDMDADGCFTCKDHTEYLPEVCH